MAVDNVKALLFEPVHELRRKGQPRPVADKLCHIKARIAQHGKVKGRIVRLGIKGRYDRGAAKLGLYDFGVIRDGVRNSVDSGREGIVYKANVKLVHAQSPLGVFS